MASSGADRRRRGPPARLKRSRTTSDFESLRSRDSASFRQRSVQGQRLKSALRPHGRPGWQMLGKADGLGFTFEVDPRVFHFGDVVSGGRRG